jgi:hypothetical protein
LSACVAALAACLLAFGLGFSLHAAMSSSRMAAAPGSGEERGSSRDRSSRPTASPLMAALSVQANPGLAAAPQVHIPVVPGSDEERPVEELPEYVRQQWERQGYKVALERRYLFAKLPDGQQVVVPVEQVVVNHTPPTVY